MGFKGAHMFLPFPGNGRDGNANNEEKLPLTGPRSMSAAVKGYLDTYVYPNSSAGIILSTNAKSANLLKSVAADEELYVICHGSGEPTRTQMKGENRKGEEQEAIDMKVLAAILKAEGLTEKAKSVHLYVCGSGLMNSIKITPAADSGKVQQFAAGQAVSNNFPDPKGTKERKKFNGSQIESSLAANLANELFLLDYKDIHVVGYLGNVIPGRGNKVGIQDWFTNYSQTTGVQPPDSSVFYPYEDPLSHRLVVKGYKHPPKKAPA